MTEQISSGQLELNLQQSAAGLAQMQSALASGELLLDPAVGQALVTSLDKTIGDVVLVSRQLAWLSAPASLGTNAVSTAMTQKFAGRAEADSRALKPQLDLYLDQLRQLKSSAVSAMGAYESTDTSLSGDLGHK